jgi:uncharacterized lipoprotein
MSRLLIPLLLSVGLLSGCALSPQVIDIYPQAHVSGPAYGQGRQISVAVNDQRPSQTLGSRGGVYGNTSTITINNNLAEAVQMTAEHALKQLGFNGNSSANPAQMSITIETLTYDTRQKNLIYYVDLAAVVRVTTTIDGSVHEGSYKTQGNHQFGQAPTADKNASIINKLLSDTIDRAFSDPNLARFMLKN